MIYLNEQMQFLHFLQELRSSLIDPFFLFLNFFDSDLFELLLIFLVWIFVSSKWGIRLGLLLSVNGLINYVSKQVLALPRPFHFDSSLAMVSASQFGCPSGGAQVSALLGCLLLYFWKHRLAPAIGIFYALLLSFSRLFLGVHFPIDILGGWTLALLSFFLFIRSVEPIEQFAAKRPTITLFGTLGIFLTITLSSPYPRTFHFAIVATVVSTLAFMLHRIREPKKA